MSGPIFRREVDVKVDGRGVYQATIFDCGAASCNKGESSTTFGLTAGYECKHLHEMLERGHDIGMRGKKNGTGTPLGFVFNLKRFGTRVAAEGFALKMFTFVATVDTNGTDAELSIATVVRSGSNQSYLHVTKHLENTVHRMSHISYRSAQAMVLNYLAYQYYEGVRCEDKYHSVNTRQTGIDFNKLARRLSEGHHRSYDVLESVASVLAFDKCVPCYITEDNTAFGLADF